MEVRTAFSKNGGNLGESGSVSFMFDQVGEITYPLAVADEDGMMEAGIEAGADDIQTDPPNEDSFSDYEPIHTIYTARDDLGAVASALEATFGEAKSVNLIWKAQNEIDQRDKASSIMKLFEALEDLDDVQNVYHNLEMSEAAMAALEE